MLWAIAGKTETFSYYSIVHFCLRLDPKGKFQRVRPYHRSYQVVRNISENENMHNTITREKAVCCIEKMGSF